VRITVLPQLGMHGIIWIIHHLPFPPEIPVTIDREMFVPCLLHPGTIGITLRHVPLVMLTNTDAILGVHLLTLLLAMTTVQVIIPMISLHGLAMRLHRLHEMCMIHVVALIKEWGLRLLTIAIPPTPLLLVEGLGLPREYAKIMIRPYLQGIILPYPTIVDQ